MRSRFASMDAPIAAVAALLIVAAPALWAQAGSDVDETSSLVVMLRDSLRETLTVGSGIIVGRRDLRLYVVTANHVVRRGDDQARHIAVRLKLVPEEEFHGELLAAADPAMDLAVVSVDIPPKRAAVLCSLPFNSLGNPPSLERGDEVYSVGNPHGVAWGTPVTPDLVARHDSQTITYQSSFIAVGHSGGALITADGKLVGMIRSDEPPFGIAVRIDRALERVREWKLPVRLRGDDSKTPLLVAAEARDTSEMRRVLGEGCGNADMHLREGETALRAAAERGDTTIIAFLLAVGADPKSPTYNYYGVITPLHMAARHGHMAVVRMLLSHGAEVDGAPGDSTGTPLAEGVEARHADIVQVLARAGATLGAVTGDSRRVPVLHLATRRDDTKMVSTLLAAGAKPKEWRPDFGTALHQAAAYGAIESAKLLLAGGADVNAGSYTPLHYAASVGSAKMVKFLLERGAKVNARDSDRNTPLLLAIADNYVPLNGDPGGFRSPGAIEVVKLLIGAGADLTARRALPQSGVCSSDSDYPLHEVVKLASVDGAKALELTRLLISAGAPVNVTDCEGATPLAVALRHDWNEGVALLRASGAK
jgi:ankyrin repeat protein